MDWNSYHKITKKYHYSTLTDILYATKYTTYNPSNRTQHYDNFQSVTTEALQWIKSKTDLGKKIKVETDTQHRYQKLLDLISI